MITVMLDFIGFLTSGSIKLLAYIQPKIFCPENVVCCLKSAAYIQKYFKLILIKEANTMNPDHFGAV